jgi:hypothetical protein
MVSLLNINLSQSTEARKSLTGVTLENSVPKCMSETTTVLHFILSINKNLYIPALSATATDQANHD